QFSSFYVDPNPCPVLVLTLIEKAFALFPVLPDPINLEVVRPSPEEVHHCEQIIPRSNTEQSQTIHCTFTELCDPDHADCCSRRNAGGRSQRPEITAGVRSQESGV